MRTKSCLIIYAFLLVCLSLGRWPAHAWASSDFETTNPPQNMPALVFEDADGNQHTLSDYKGRFVLLNLWATWCIPCVKEMPSLEILQKNFDPRTFIVIPLSEDRDKVSVSVFYQKHALTHLPIAVDNAGRAPLALHLEGFPTTFLINPQGQEIAHMEGDTDWSTPASIAFVQAQLNATTRP